MGLIFLKEEKGELELSILDLVDMAFSRDFQSRSSVSVSEFRRDCW
jgi:hypothetical protein